MTSGQSASQNMSESSQVTIRNGEETEIENKPCNSHGLLPSKDDLVRLRKKIQSSPHRWQRYTNPRTGTYFGFTDESSRFAVLKTEGVTLQAQVFKEDQTKPKLSLHDTSNSKESRAHAQESSDASPVSQASTNRKPDDMSELVASACTAGNNAARLMEEKLPYQSSQASFERRVFFEDLALFHYYVNGITFPGESRNVYPIHVGKTPVCLYMIYHFVVHFGGFRKLLDEKEGSESLNTICELIPGNHEQDDKSFQDTFYTVYQKYLFPFEKHIGGTEHESQKYSWSLTLSDAFRIDLRIPVFPMDEESTIGGLMDGRNALDKEEPPSKSPESSISSFQDDEDSIQSMYDMAPISRAGLVRLKRKQRMDEKSTATKETKVGKGIAQSEYRLVGIYGQGGSNARLRLDRILRGPWDISDSLTVNDWETRQLMRMWAEEVISRDGIPISRSWAQFPSLPSMSLTRASGFPLSGVTQSTAQNMSVSLVPINASSGGNIGTACAPESPTGGSDGVASSPSKAKDLLLYLRHKDGTRDELWSPDSFASDGESPHGFQGKSGSPKSSSEEERNTGGASRSRRRRTAAVRQGIDRSASTDTVAAASALADVATGAGRGNKRPPETPLPQGCSIESITTMLRERTPPEYKEQEARLCLLDNGLAYIVTRMSPTDYSPIIYQLKQQREDNSPTETPSSSSPREQRGDRVETWNDVSHEAREQRAAGIQHSKGASSSRTRRGDTKGESPWKTAAYQSMISNDQPTSRVPASVMRPPYEQTLADGGRSTVIVTSTSPTFQDVRFEGQTGAQRALVRPCLSRVYSERPGGPLSLIQMPPIVSVEERSTRNKSRRR